MPLLTFNSRIRVSEPSTTLTLTARHSLHVDGPSHTTCAPKCAFPASIDVLLRSNLVLSFAWVVNNAKIPAADVKSSVLPRHVIQYLTKNSEVLGISNISDVYLDDDDGLVKLNISAARPFPTHTTRSVVYLSSIHLKYGCKTNSESHSPIPSRYLLNQAIEKFASNLVKRYPLIFGPWCKRLDQEKSFFPIIARSLLSVSNRSPNADFRDQVRRNLKVLKKRIRAAEDTSQATLTALLGGVQDGHIDQQAERDPTPKLALQNDGNENENEDKDEDEATLCTMLGKLFRVGVRPPLFKGTPVLEADYSAPEIRSPEMNTISGTRLESPCPPIHIGTTSTTTTHNTYTHPSSPISFDALIPDMAFDLDDQSELKFNEARSRDGVNVFADEVDENGEMYLFWPIEEDDGGDSETEFFANAYTYDAWLADFISDDEDDSSDYFFEASAIPGAFGGEGETDHDIELELCSDDGSLCLSEDEPFEIDSEADAPADEILILDEMYCEVSHEDPLTSETGRGIRRLEDARKRMNPQMSEEEDILADSEDVPGPAVSLFEMEMDLETHAPACCGSQGVVLT